MCQTKEVTCLIRSRRLPENLIDAYQSSSTAIPGGSLALRSLHRSRPNIASNIAFKNAHHFYYKTTQKHSDLVLPSQSHSATREQSDLVLPSWSHSATREHSDLVLTSRSHSATWEHSDLVLSFRSHSVTGEHSDLVLPSRSHFATREHSDLALPFRT